MDGLYEKVPDEARSELVPENHEDAQQAVLDFKLLQRNETLALIEIQLQTGRTHQIRLQCSVRNLPIVGDELYGSTLPFGPTTDDYRQRWIALHARRLAFTHPISREPVDQTAPFSNHWECFDDFGPTLFPNRRS